MTTDRPRIDIAEFRRLGYLQELNRRFLHPCGLALEVVIEEDGSEAFGGVWDYRDDPDGMLFADGEIDRVKVATVQAEIEKHRAVREAECGDVVQPPDGA